MTPSVQHATRLLLCRPHKRTDEDRRLLAQLRQARPDIDEASIEVPTFLNMVRERTGEYLEQWLTEVQTSHLEELAPFVVSVQRDQAAVKAG